MKQLFLTFMLWLLTTGAMTAQHLNSPNGNFALQFKLTAKGTPVYSLNYKGREVIKESKMGFTLRPDFALDTQFSVIGTEFNETDTTWQPVLGQYSKIRTITKKCLSS